MRELTAALNSVIGFNPAVILIVTGLGGLVSVWGMAHDGRPAATAFYLFAAVGFVMVATRMHRYL